MKIHFLGANRQVTGSRYCVETSQRRVMVDCGMFQEREFSCRNWHPSPIEAESVDVMVVTHAHIDHCGLIPRFCKQGFKGPILASEPTAGFLPLMLTDSAEIQMEDAAYKEKRHRKDGRAGRYPPTPLYDTRDVQACLPLVTGHPYDKPIRLSDDISVTFRDAGHILGSAMLEFAVTEGGRNYVVAFSGDIGQANKPLIRDPTQLDHADFVVMESTYGDREHEQAGDIENQLANIINTTVEARGNVVIPTFAVERAQELMYYIGKLVSHNRIPTLDVYLDSPMAVDVTEVFRKFHDYLDEETWQLISSGHAPFRFPGLKLTRSAEESKRINDARSPKIIMSTSGMCTAGRIKHHLRQNVTRPENTILFVGYQAVGTLGRQILDGKPEVRIHGRDYPVKATVAQIYGFSGHADRTGLLKWLSHIAPKPKTVYLTHGDEAAAESLAAELRQNQGHKVLIPHYESIHDLT